MQTQAHVVWKNLEASPALSDRIDHEVRELGHFFRRITACRVVIEVPHHHHQRGRHFHVKIEVSVPGRVLAVTRDPANHAASEDAYAAVSEAFSSMRRQLEDYIRVRRHAVKHHDGLGEGAGEPV
jgi:ribosomal subunit interface protein